MKTVVVLCLALVAVQAIPQQKYTNRYDNVNVSDVLKNERLLVSYIKCALEQTRCSPEGKELKAHIIEAMENNCAKCTEKQRAGVRQVIGHLINYQKAYWDQLTAKYDPTRKYVTMYESELRTAAV